MYNVLIVEDDPMVAMINKQFLELNPLFKLVGICYDGRSGLKAIESQEVDLVLLDVHMPNLNGLELLRKIRENSYHISVIMVTAANDVPTLEEALHLGVVDYLVKPFTQERFHLALNKYITRKGAITGETTLTQERIDSLVYRSDEHTNLQQLAPPKGIHERTLSALVEYLKTSGGNWLSGDDIAEEIKLSSVTVRRYMNHLIKTNVVENKMDYETGGRPRLLYRYVGQ